MFDSNSRYAKLAVTDTVSATGKVASVVKLRRLPYVPGLLAEVKGIDRIDIEAHRRYSDSTKFWHIADANTELEASELLRPDSSENPIAKTEIRYILFPEK
jgi:hypothetical protein